MTDALGIATANDPPPLRRELRITLLDGSSAFADLLQDALRLFEPGLPATVNTFDRAVSLATLVATEPNLIIIDPHVATGTDGWELIGRAEASPDLTGVPIVICCTDGGADGEADGATSQLLRLRKPFHVEELRAVLRHAGVLIRADERLGGGAAVRAGGRLA